MCKKYGVGERKRKWIKKQSFVLSRGVTVSMSILKKKE